MGMTLEEEAIAASNLLKGKMVVEIVRHKKTEVLIKFNDNTKLFVHQTQDGLELSIT